jgi:hypothetical protein
MSRVCEPTWRKAIRTSDPSIAACVEIAAIDDRRAIRDSKNPGGPELSFTVAEWRTFVGDIKRNEFNL